MITLTYAIGLLGLIGIPVLIAIYIIKNKYTEQTVTSTYLWNLSEKFIKKRIPISRIVGIIALILQILAVVIFSFIMAEPVIVNKGAASSYCFVLDGSGSMNIAEGDGTRFDYAKSGIREKIDSAVNGSTFTLIYAGATVDEIYADISDKNRAEEALEALKASDVSPDSAAVLAAAQKYFDENRSAETYLFTDKDYEKIRNIEVVNVVSATAENYSLGDVTYGIENGKLVVKGTVKSYLAAAELTVELAFPDSAGGYSTVDTAAVTAVPGEDVSFELSSEGTEFASFRVRIPNGDALAADNETIVYNIALENVGKTLVVSETESFFLRGALSAAGCPSVELVKPDDYEADGYGGYGLYVFDGCCPSEMPREGAVWFVDPPATVKGSGFTYRGPATSHSSAEFSTSTATSVRKLLEGVSDRKFEVDGYVKCGMGSKFTTLATIDGSAVIFAGSNVYGNREAVFAFGFNRSASFALSADLPTLIGNLLNYSFPSVVDETVIMCGDSLAVNVVSGCEQILLTSPSGATAYLDTTVAISEYRLTEAGSYNLKLTMKGGGERELNVYSVFPAAERDPAATGIDFRLAGLPLGEKLDGYYDDLLWLFVALAVIAVADFGVYCYEQYQLR